MENKNNKTDNKKPSKLIAFFSNLLVCSVFASVIAIVLALTAKFITWLI